ALLDLIMDSGYSYHMTPRLDILFDFLESDGGSVLLGDNRECKIRGIGKGYTVKLQSGKVKVINVSTIVLSRTRRDNYVYSFDGHAVTGELNANVEEKDSLMEAGAIHLSQNHVFHERTKHINVRYHFIKEVLEAKTVKVLKVGTEHNVADALTKVIPRLKLQHCLELLSVGIG
ncbi:hypothetical protein Tco_1580107, partial [Tanacetum coccineum]